MNETQARVWIRQIIEVVRQGATLTEFTIDDQAAEMALKAIDSELLWSWLWKVIGGLLEGDDVNVVGAPGPEELGAIDPLMVIAIIKAVVELWKAFRKQ